MLTIETCGGESCDGCSGCCTSSGAGETKSGRTVLYMGLTDVQVLANYYSIVLGVMVTLASLETS